MAKRNIPCIHGWQGLCNLHHKYLGQTRHTCNDQGNRALLTAICRALHAPYLFQLHLSLHENRDFTWLLVGYVLEMGIVEIVLGWHTLGQVHEV